MIVVIARHWMLLIRWQTKHIIIGNGIGTDDPKTKLEEGDLNIKATSDTWNTSVG